MKRQYAVCPVGLICGYVATELGVQIFVQVADPKNPTEARARQAQIEKAYGWPSSLLVDRGAL